MSGSFSHVSIHNAKDRWAKGFGQKGTFSLDKYSGDFSEESVSEVETDMNLLLSDINQTEKTVVILGNKASFPTNSNSTPEYKFDTRESFSYQMNAITDEEKNSLGVVKGDYLQGFLRVAVANIDYHYTLDGKAFTFRVAVGGSSGAKMGEKLMLVDGVFQFLDIGVIPHVWVRNRSDAVKPLSFWNQNDMDEEQYEDNAIQKEADLLQAKFSQLRIPMPFSVVMPNGEETLDTKKIAGSGTTSMNIVVGGIVAFRDVLTDNITEAQLANDLIQQVIRFDIQDLNALIQLSIE
jgi:hypothetical protein